MSEPEFEIQIITPDMCRAWAEEFGIDIKNYRARDVDDIKSYTAYMRSWGWRLNGDAIIFDSNGVLINGRKRILACIASDAEFLSVVVRNVDPKARRRIDQHKQRSEADVAKVAGFKAHKPLTAAASAILDIAMTGLPSQTSFEHGKTIDLLLSRPDIEDLVSGIDSVTLAPWYSPSDLAALVFLTDLIDRAASNAFFELLDAALKAPNSISDDPIQRVAQALIANQSVHGRTGLGNSLSRYATVSATAKAWNAWRAGKPLPSLVGDKVALADAPRLAGLPSELFAAYRRTSLDTSVAPPRIDHSLLAQKKECVHIEVRTFLPHEAMIYLNDFNGPLRRAPISPLQSETGGSDDRGSNRSISPIFRDLYARSLISNDWMVTGQSIKFSAAGRLIDGQHRLAACAKSGKPLKSVVVYGLEEDVFHTFDVAINHTYARILADAGSERPKAMQSVLRNLWAYREHGLGSSKAKPGHADLDSILEEWPEIDRYADAAAGLVSSYGLTIDQLITLMAILHRIDEEKAAHFFDRFKVGGGIGKGSPIWELRRTLGKAAGERMKPWHRPAVVLMAWNSFVGGSAPKLPKTPAEVAEAQIPAPFDVGYAPTIARKEGVSPQQGCFDLGDDLRQETP